MKTEFVLREWRFGQPQAERLVASLLHLEGFENVDPQHPLGGPDGLKDVKCRKDGLCWIAAAYFPPTIKEFTEIRKKFEDDFSGVAKNDAQAFAFFVNQHLTVTERGLLISEAGDIRAEIYHLERMRGLLDAPKGCGIRLEYLRIAMTEEEQFAFWSSMNQDVVRKLVDHEMRRDAQFRSLDSKLDTILQRTNALELALAKGASHLAIPNDTSVEIEMPTRSLSLTTLCWLHRIVSQEIGLPEAVSGRLRAVNVWIGPPGSSPGSATYVPPPPDQLVPLTQAWITWWKREHRRLESGTREKIVNSLAEFFHRFLNIHPFLDGNGRVALILLDQAARELLNQGVTKELTSDLPAYYAALAAADRGDLTAVKLRITAALT